MFRKCVATFVQNKIANIAGSSRPTLCQSLYERATHSKANSRPPKILITGEFSANYRLRVSVSGGILIFLIGYAYKTIFQMSTDI